MAHCLPPPAHAATSARHALILMESRVHNLAPGELFEVPIDIKSPSILQFSFSTSEGSSVEFSVAFHPGGKKSKETTLLPASTYTENIGEVLPASACQPARMRMRPRPCPTKPGPGLSRVQVLLPGQGVCVVRFHNPTGWFYSSQVKVRYSLSAGPTLSAPPDAARPKKPPPPPPPARPRSFDANGLAISPAAAEAPARGFDANGLAIQPAAAEAPPSAAEEAAAATPTPKVLSPEMGAALSRQLARRPSLDEVTSAGILQLPEHSSRKRQEDELRRDALEARPAD